MRLRCAFLGLGLVALAAGTAQAALVVSSHATRHVHCANGKCVAKSANAFLNAGELGALLAAGDVDLVPGATAMDIQIEAPLSWTSESKLTLDAYRSIVVDAPVSDAGPGALWLLVNHGGSGGALTFGEGGQIHFLSTANALSINGSSYMLVPNLATLAIDIADKPDGFFALASDFDAGHKTYHGSAVLTAFSGHLEGLGNTISNFTMKLTTGTQFNDWQGLFAQIAEDGTVENLRLKDVDITAVNSPFQETMGALVGLNLGTLAGDTVSGSLHGNGTQFAFDLVGGLAGINRGTIVGSQSSVTIKGGTWAGGLVAWNNGTIADSSVAVHVSGAGTAGGLAALNAPAGINRGAVMRSFATGAVDNARLPPSNVGFVGGLVGSNMDAISDSYATANVKGFNGSSVAGFVGHNESAIESSYATGAVSGRFCTCGGFVSENVNGTYGDDYWDTDTSGISGPSSISGVTGLTTAQFLAALPDGFDPNVWAQSAGVNGGYPYLKSNPPQ